MRACDRKRILAVIAATAAILYLGCNNSNDVTSPGTTGSVVNVSGDWSGMYESDSPALCANGMASASLTQQGNRVSGPFKALSCGIDGTFQGVVAGNLLTGSVGMAGCTGGAVSGRLDASGLTFTVGDFTKTLIAGDTEVLPGGRVTLQR